MGTPMTCEIASCPHHTIDKSICDFDTPINPRNRSLVIASLELGRVLADRGKVSFRAKGTCMFPCIRPDDVLQIESRTIDQVAVGDIAVCRTPDYLYGHRIIEKGIKENRAYIVTRSDRTRGGGDAPVINNNLLGVIVAIERKGKRVPLQPIPYPRLVRRFLFSRLNFTKATNRVRSLLFKKADTILASIQTWKLYRFFIVRRFASFRPQSTFIVHIPFNSKFGDALYRKLKPDEFDIKNSLLGHSVDRWTLVLHLNGTRHPAASATFARHDADSWKLEESNVRVRYRGAGLEGILIQEAEKILAKNGIRASVIHI
jgi:hypothetical protein